jgi:hypothetical protein
MPRTNTEAFTKKGFVDFTKKLMCPGGNYREVKKSTIKASIRPTATYKMNTHIVEPFEVKYVIKNPVKFDTHAGVSGMRTQDVTIQDVQEPTKEINTTPIYAEDVYASHGSGATVRYVDHSHMDTDRYIQDTLHSSVQSKMSQSIQLTSIEDIFDVDIHTKDAMNISYTPLRTGHTKEDRIHKDLELQRRVLATTMATNKQRNIYARPQHEHQAIQKRNRPLAHVATNRGTIQRQSSMDLNSREYTLKPTLNAGGMTGRGSMPHHQQNSDVRLGETMQHARNRRVMEMQAERH